MNSDEALADEEEAERIYQTDKLFREFADKQHKGHCYTPCPLCCIEEDGFLKARLAEWDDDLIDS